MLEHEALCGNGEGVEEMVGYEQEIRSPRLIFFVLENMMLCVYLNFSFILLIDSLETSFN